LECNGLVSLRDMVDVRRSAEIHVRHGSNEAPRSGGRSRWRRVGSRKSKGSFDRVPSEGGDDSTHGTRSADENDEAEEEGEVSSDEDDVGGEEGLEETDDPQDLIDKRGFEIEFVNGEVVKFVVRLLAPSHERADRAD
jgi:hypothetical protein